MPADEGFHEGELVVQRRAGLTDPASRLVGMLTRPNLDGGMSRFAAERDLAVITSRDQDGVLWSALLYGRPGFCSARGATLTVSRHPHPGSPLHELRRGEQAGLLLIDFGRRRRLRINGTLARVDPDGFEVAAEQAFANCPKYIQQRLVYQASTAPDRLLRVSRFEGLEPVHIAQIRRADTFILGTSNPTRGADTSHRGGPAGFVRVESDELWWPDYPGNNLFNSLGNIVEHPAAALLFMDFAAGTSLQLSGRSHLEWSAPGGPDDDAGTGRRVRFFPEQVVRTDGLPFRQVDAQNPLST